MQNLRAAGKDSSGILIIQNLVMGKKGWNLVKNIIFIKKIKNPNQSNDSNLLNIFSYIVSEPEMF